jgi:hypothetical protein
MAFGLGPGVITDGIGADGFKTGVPFSVPVGANSQVLPGTALKRNILTVVGRNDSYPNLSAPDQACYATSANSGYAAGVVYGTQKQALSNTNSIAGNVRLSLCRSGVVPTRVAALAGGAAITIGALVGFSAAVGASTSDIPTVQGSNVPGAALGIVTAYQIVTATTAPAVNPGAQTITVTSTDGITTATALAVDPNLPTAETVTPTAVTAGVRATDSLTVAGTFAAGSVLTAIINGTTVTYTVLASDTNNAGAAASFAKAINASAVVAGLAPILLPAQVAANVIYLTASNQGTAANAYTLTASATGTNTVTAATATFTGGVAGSITAPFANAHASGAIVLGQNTTFGATLIPVPAATGSLNVGLVSVDLALAVS